jgi:hypothetical protein
MSHYRRQLRQKIRANPSDRKIGPGLYITASNELHLDIPELLRHLNVADTPENREEATRQAMAAARRVFPTVPQDVCTDPELPAFGG